MINLKDNEFLAIKITQPFREFYSVKLKADFLLERSFSKTADFYGNGISGGQRAVRNTRLNDISEFIDSDEASFPNSIIVAVNYDYNDLLVEEDISWKVEAINEELDLYKITVPTNAKVCSIVDGQHRLFAFNQSKYKDMELNCSIYLDLVPSLQAAVFATINFNQTPVDKSLAYTLFGYQLDNLAPKYWSPDLLAVNLCRYFAENEDSFFYSHINYRLKTRNVERGSWVISIASFVDGVMSLISKNPKEDRYKINKKELLSLAGRKVLSQESNYSLREYFISGNDEAIKQVIQSYFNAVEQVFDIDDGSDSVLVKTIGIKALFSLLNEILLNNEINKNLLNSFPELLTPAKEIRFEQTDFYSSSTKGQTRLLNFLKHTVLDIPLAELPGNQRSGVLEEYESELKAMKK
ncbi:DGQHR domain-containing protein [Vibrio splendidus]